MHDADSPNSKPGAYTILSNNELNKCELYRICLVAPKNQAIRGYRDKIQLYVKTIIEGLYIAASAKNSISLDFNCADSVMRVNRFWDSIRGVSRHIDAISET